MRDYGRTDNSWGMRRTLMLLRILATLRLSVRIQGGGHFLSLVKANLPSHQSESSAFRGFWGAMTVLCVVALSCGALAEGSEGQSFGLHWLHLEKDLGSCSFVCGFWASRLQNMPQSSSYGPHHWMTVASAINDKGTREPSTPQCP